MPKRPVPPYELTAEDIAASDDELRRVGLDPERYSYAAKCAALEQRARQQSKEFQFFVSTSHVNMASPPPIASHSFILSAVPSLSTARTYSLPEVADRVVRNAPMLYFAMPTEQQAFCIFCRCPVSSHDDLIGCTKAGLYKCLCACRSADFKAG